MITESNRLSSRASVLKTISESVSEKTRNEPDERGPVSEYFGELTFGIGQMREKLSKEAYLNLLKSLEQGKPLPKETSNEIANAIKEWATSKGATHFCHWFQPMTGLTAEKHDAFLSVQRNYHSELTVIEKFTGSQLIKGEPDASSFPSGGMRSTFEARGYTAWDPGSPIFIVEVEGGKTLCLPSVFFGYHGEALDLKTPLLRSVESLSKRACAFLKLLGDVDVKSVTSTLGAEQEYFLVDKRLAALRPDLVMSGRTLLGAAPPRGQQLEDHYFGAIPSRVKIFMSDLEQELYRLGIPVKTRHNEVAPSQFELAPIFENANIAADHNVLTMETLKRVANRHGFLCLLHEKPFAGLNGSGKHCNWSISNDKGENLLEPGKTPHQNLRFLAIMSVITKAVHKHAALLRASITSPGNDHRLGANEAPPAIISVFLGSTLSGIFESLAKGEVNKHTATQKIDLGVASIPMVLRDNTDRNRTSPFAFTGNKFEFRAVGASTNISIPVSILNAAVSDVLDEATTKLEGLLLDHEKRDEAVMALVRDYAKESKPIYFEGNNYSDSWIEEAKGRGLPILKSSVEALQVLRDESLTSFLVKEDVLRPNEIESRYNVWVERYVKTLMIEMTTLEEMVRTMVVPSIEAQLLQSQKVLEGIQSKTLISEHKQRLDEIESVYEDVLTALKGIQSQIHNVDQVEDDTEQMKCIGAQAIPARDMLRIAVDKAEGLIADNFWELPKYREMLFLSNLT